MLHVIDLVVDLYIPITYYFLHWLAGAGYFWRGDKMTTAHTATPWHVIGGFILSKITGQPIAEQVYDSKEAGTSLDLIVSAVNNTAGQGINPEAVPDMLKALEKVLPIIELMHGGRYSLLRNAVRSAIAKAKGDNHA